MKCYKGSAKLNSQQDTHLPGRPAAMLMRISS